LGKNGLEPFTGWIFLTASTIGLVILIPRWCGFASSYLPKYTKPITPTASFLTGKNPSKGTRFLTSQTNKVL
jgi:hypothetical protein